MAEASKITRRHLVQAGAASTALVGLGGVGRLGEIAEAAGAAPPELRRATYLPLSGDRFEIRGPEGASSLRLVSVGDLPAAANVAELRGRDDAFALRFRGSGERLGSGIHPIRHPEIGKFHLFLSPIDRAGSTQDYELLVDRTAAVPPPAVRRLAARIRRGRGRRT